jgi:hypothetical protein
VWNGKVRQAARAQQGSRMPDVGVLLAETEQSLGADMRRREV